MATMKAFVRTDADSMSVEMMDVAVPDIRDDEVLVSIEAFGVGIHDRYFIPQDAEFPYVIGIEGAGRIAAVGSGVTGFAIGDRVVFTSSMNPTGGTWAESAAVKQSALMAIPDGLSSVQATTVPVAGGTTLQGLMDLGLGSGDSLFIAGASGAIGTFAIQIAASRGMRVAGSASAKNLAYMESLGAEKAVDYTSPDWQREVKEWSGGGVDGALAIQPGTGASSVAAVRDGGRVVTVSEYSSGNVSAERGVTVAQLTHDDDVRGQTEDLLAAIADGTIRTIIEGEYPFAEALEALEKTETRHARGKLVVKVKD